MSTKIYLNFFIWLRTTLSDLHLDARITSLRFLPIFVQGLHCAAFFENFPVHIRPKSVLTKIDEHYSQDVLGGGIRVPLTGWNFGSTLARQCIRTPTLREGRACRSAYMKLCPCIVVHYSAKCSLESPPVLNLYSSKLHWNLLWITVIGYFQNPHSLRVPN